MLITDLQRDGWDLAEQAIALFRRRARAYAEIDPAAPAGAKRGQDMTDTCRSIV